MQTDYTFRRKFPLGHLLHPNPFYGGIAQYHESSGGRSLYAIYLLAEIFLADKSTLKTGPAGLELYWQ